MLRIESGNIVTGRYPIFCQQVNCKGVMGAGLARQIRNEFPEVYHDYKRLCNCGDARLGDIQIVHTFNNRVCVNMMAQYNYGTDKVYTNYDAFAKCLQRLEMYLISPSGQTVIASTENKVVAFPMYIGCGLAGGDWNKIYKMIKEFSERIPWDVVLVKYKG